MKNYYEILEVHECASIEIIQKVYKILAKKYHPDLQDKDVAKEREEKFKLIAEAYEILSDKKKRKAYDEELKFYNESQKSATIDLDDYKKLQDYCSKLENELNSYRGTYSHSGHEQPQEASQDFSSSDQYYQNAAEQAYQDAYVNTLRNFGYKIRYKKTFKQACQHILKSIAALTLTVLILSVAALILWNIPSVQERIKDALSFLF
ncbi:MAG: DnaJ domain-containing protein [Oscillospiraceae bacterium]|nr:DnaJ domain-containing protein [Oscillospiraceae bacterium]